MAESYTLTTPETKPAVTNLTYRVTSLYFDWEGAIISVNLLGDNGERMTTGYGGPPGLTPEADRDKAVAMMKFLNTANMTTKSLHKRVLEQLAKDGKLSGGSVTGTPDPGPAPV